MNKDKIGNAISLLPSGELLVDTKYANEAKSVRLMDREGFTRVFEEPKTGHWIIDGCLEMCDQCGEPRDFPHWKYCPNCGARMEE